MPIPQPRLERQSWKLRTLFVAILTLILCPIKPVLAADSGKPPSLPCYKNMELAGRCKNDPPKVTTLEIGQWQLATLASQIRTVYSGQSSYGMGDLMPILSSANAIPHGMRAGTNPESMRNPWGGSVTVQAGARGEKSNFTITFVGVPHDDCVNFPLTHEGTVGAAYVVLTINSSEQTLPMTQEAGKSACNSAAVGNTLAFTYE